MGRSQHSLFALFLGVIVCPLLEELFFRKILFKNIAKYGNVFVANMVVSFLFGLAHRDTLEIFPFIHAGPTFITGIYFTFIFVQNRTIWAPIIIHIMWNSSVVILDFVSNSVEKLEYLRNGHFISISFLTLWVPGILIMYVGYKPLRQICKDNWNKKIIEN